MLAASQGLASLAVLLVGVIYGTDVFSAVVLRPAMAALGDRELTQAAGRIHKYGDQRLPLPGTAGTVAAAAAAICAGFADHGGEAALAGIAFAALLAWLGLYLRIAAPINRRMTAAAREHRTPVDIRAMQKRWDSIITARAALQGGALALLIAALVMS
ncbi:MAG TPA: hypothetical protein VGF81_02730 [Solirubrobacteraceae bacterium]|jgi:hypothetical protein